MKTKLVALFSTVFLCACGNGGGGASSSGGGTVNDPFDGTWIYSNGVNTYQLTITHNLSPLGDHSISYTLPNTTVQTDACNLNDNIITCITGDKVTLGSQAYSVNLLTHYGNTYTFYDPNHMPSITDKLLGSWVGKDEQSSPYPCNLTITTTGKTNVYNIAIDDNNGFKYDYDKELQVANGKYYFVDILQSDHLELDTDPANVTKLINTSPDQMFSCVAPGMVLTKQ